VLVGRDEIQERIARALTAAGNGDGSAVALCGDPGAGKTALLDYAVSIADGMQVLRARSVELEAALPCATLAEVLRPILKHLPSLPPLQAGALSAALRLGPPVSTDRFAVCAATVSLVQAAAHDRPVLIVIDDAHWLDQASAEPLLFLARRLDVSSACALFAYRDGPGLPVPPDSLTRIAVPGLGPEAAAELLASTGTMVDPVTMSWLMRETAGNPLALTDLPHLLTADEIDVRAHTVRPAPLTGSLEQFYGRAVRRLPDTAQRALLIVAMLDGHGAGVMRSVLRVASLDVSALLPAADAGLVTISDGELTFRHPLVRSAVHQSVPPSALRAAHLLVAEGLAAATDPELLDARAWHLADAAVGWDEEAADLLEQTARAALERSGQHAAALAFERSARLTADPTRRRSRLLGAARAEFAAGRTARCIGLLDDLDDESSVEVLQLRGRVEMWSGAPRAGGERLVAVAERMAADDPLRALTLMLDAASGIAMSGWLARAQEVAERMRAIGSALGPPMDRLTQATLASIMALRGAGRDEEARLDEAMAALPITEPGALLELFISFGAGYLFLDRLDTARDMFTRYVGLGREAGALSGLSFALSALSVTEFRAGHWDAALGAALESTRLAEDTGRHTDVPNCLVTVSLVEAGRGSTSARAHAERAVELATAIGLRVVEAQARSVLGLLDLGLGNLDAAIAQLERCGTTARDTGTGQVCNLQWAPELVEALARAGRPGQARPVVDYMSERAATLDAPFVAAAAARCRGLVAVGPSYEPDFEDALGHHRRGAQRPFETARTQLAYGERLRRDRRRKDARVQLNSAWQTFGELGAQPWTERAAVELRATGVEVAIGTADTLASLTPQEREVAHAVATGASNREVAARMFLSEKTVEFHLSNVYRKLELRSRTQLANLVRRNANPA
jgi:DNA-binding CsgD family transcriptional regulator